MQRLSDESLFSECFRRPLLPLMKDTIDILIRPHCPRLFLHYLCSIDDFIVFKIKVDRNEKKDVVI
jgi:hypothetical protein